MTDPSAAKIKTLVDGATDVVIVQADNPDGDSLGSALALEQILGDMGKNPSLYCGVDIPVYLRYLSGWDRVAKDLPRRIDLGIIVDTSSMTLLEKLADSGQQGWLAAKPVIVLDHHADVDCDIPFAAVVINDKQVSSTGELIHKLAGQLGWPLNQPAQAFIMSAILGDTQGLTNDLASAETYRVMAKLIEAGVSRPKIEELRRAHTKMPPDIYRYKATLIQRTEFAANGQIAHLTIPQAEINDFSPLYNPSALIQGDMLQVEDVAVAIVFKSYDDGKITAAIRCNPTHGIGNRLAEHFGGGGHVFASGFKITDGRRLDDVKAECLELATKLLAEHSPK